MRLVCSLAVCCVLSLSAISLASYEEIDVWVSKEVHYQCLARGFGQVEPPYCSEFQWMLVYEPGCLHFVFGHPLDPSQQHELEDYLTECHLDWSVCRLDVGGETWTSINTMVAGDAQKLPEVFLNHLRRLSFIKILD